VTQERQQPHLRIKAALLGRSQTSKQHFLAAVVSTLSVFVQENANRLKAYKSKLVVFPRRSKKPKQGDSSAEELSTVQQHDGRHVLPIVHEKAQPELVAIPEELKVLPPSTLNPCSCFQDDQLITDEKMNSAKQNF
jgi:hypothetical protein